MSDDLFQDEPSESLHYEKWNVDVVRKFLEEQKIDDDSVDKLCTCTTFQEKKFEGKDLPRLTRQDLNNMKIIDFDEQDRLLKLFSGLRQVKIRSLSKVFNDSIHGHIELHPLLVKIIDTPQFQRLRDIKQLGGCYFVYPGASHNRFEHSIGVCHLAGELVETLRAHQPELNITDKDVLCVKMAGLCHDLGHGPFSHMFDKVYMPLYAVEKDLGSWKHEKGSIDMLDHLIEENELKLEEYDITREDIIFVKEQIVGYPIDDKNRKKPSGDGWLYEGRKEEKNFLYEIVASQKNGIDVDKWDYIARDCHHLGITMGFDYCRFMKYARVISVDERLHICTRDKEVDELYKMFHTRLMLHKTAYQHKTVCVIERMISEAFSMVENKLKFGKEGKKVSLPNCIDDMCAYTSLTDHVFHQILLSDDKDLEQAQKLLKNILTRDLYKFIGQTTPFSLSDECSDKSSDKSSDKGSDKKSDKWLKKFLNLLRDTAP